MQLIEHIIEVTGGSSSDLESASSIAEVMVKSLGMSDKIGLRVYQVPISTDTQPRILVTGPLNRW
jgi:ATP-dependent Zn protease